jgi:hypothetical protein
MKASDQAKQAGLETLNEMSELIGVSPQALAYQAKNKPDVFKANLDKALSNKNTLSLDDTLKLHGYKSLAQLARLAPWSANTLKKWHETKPDLFRALLEMHKEGGV